MRNSALYAGRVTHTRLRPRRHHLSYGVYAAFIDLDELPDLHRRLRLFSANRFNLLSFHAGDHGDGSDTPLAVQIRRRLAEAGIDAAGPVRVLCYPRVLGLVFNPLSTFFCHDAEGRLVAILYEVNNTFGQRHSYLIAVDDAAARPIRQHCAKTFYVSPFMGMEMDYDFAVMPPAGEVTLAIRGHDADGPVISAIFTGQRRELTDRTVLLTFLRHPLLALKVLGGIHWEALRLLAKGLRLKPRPAPPAGPVSVGAPGPLPHAPRLPEVARSG